MIGKPRKPWLAGGLSFIQPGLGHLYCGSWAKAINYYLLSKLIILTIIALLLWLPIAKINVLLAFMVIIGFYVYLIRNALLLAKQEEDTYRLRPFNRWYVYILILALVWTGENVFFNDFIRNSLAKTFRFPTASMMPTLFVGDHIITNNMIYHFKEPERNELITFPYPEDESKIFLKRIIGIPGDIVEMKNKVLFLNGAEIKDDEYTQHVDRKIIDGNTNPRDNFGPLTVPSDSFFVLGDNREQSLDSRFWGFVKREKVLGKVSVIYWSWNSDVSWSEAIRWDRIGLRL